MHMHIVKHCNETSRYRTQCSSEHALLAKHLQQARGRRGLFFEFTGISKWGIGHAIWNVYLLHDVCRQLRRYCHIRLYDMDLGAMMGYAADNQSWSEPTEDELSNYRGAGPTKVLRWKYGTWGTTQRGATCERCRRDKSLGLIVSLRALANVSLIHVRTPGPLQTIEPDLLHVLQYDVDLRDVKAPSCPRSRRHTDSELRYCRKILPRLTRCFCRFVTDPRYEIDPSTWNVSYQLRTGYADIGDASHRASKAGPALLQSIAMPSAGTASASECSPLSAIEPSSWRYSEMQRWLLGACRGTSALRQLAQGYLLTDAPPMGNFIRAQSQCAGNDAGAEELRPTWMNSDDDNLSASRAHPCHDHPHRKPGVCASRKATGRCGNLWGCDLTCGKCRTPIDNGLPSTRSWDASFEAKKMAFADLVVASRSTIAFLGSSSFAVPLVARSLCLERLHKLDHVASPCPNFSAVFNRGLFGITQVGFRQEAAQHFESLALPAMPKWHPCQRIPLTSCMARYVASVVGSTVRAARDALAAHHRGLTH